MINSYNDSFMKNFNGEEQVKSYNETFINKPDGNGEGSYNRFFMNNTNTNQSESAYKNPFINKNGNIDYGEEYVKSFVKDFNTTEEVGGSNSFDISNKPKDVPINNNMPSSTLSMGSPFNDNIKNIRENTDDINHNIDAQMNEVGFHKSNNFNQENHNAPFGNEDDKSDGRYIRSFIKDTSSDNNINNINNSFAENNDFVVINEEIDKELNLNNNKFNGNSATKDNNKERTNSNESIGNGNFNDDGLKYKNITFQKELKKQEKVTYSDMFEGVTNKPSTTISENISNAQGNNFNIDPSLKINGIHEEKKGSYKKFFFNDNENQQNLNEDEFIEKRKESFNDDVWEGKVDYSKIEDQFIDNYKNLNENRYENYSDQEKVNKKFFGRFFNVNTIKDEEEINYSPRKYEDEVNNQVNNEVKSNRYRSYNKPSGYNLDDIEQKRINDEFFKKYFTKLEEEDVVDNKDSDSNSESNQDSMVSELDTAELDKILKKYREEQLLEEDISVKNYNDRYIEDSYSNSYKEDTYINKGNENYNYNFNKGAVNKSNLDYFNNEYINNTKNNNSNNNNNSNSNFEGDRRNRINYPQNPISTLNNNNLSNAGSYSTSPLIMQFSNKIENLFEKQYLTFNTLGTKVLRGAVDLNKVQNNNDTVKLPNPGIYRIDVNIEYNFIVTEYLAGRDYQLVFTLEDSNTKPIIIMNKVAPTSSKSSYIADGFRRSELIEVREAPYELRLKLNNFSFSNQVPLDINNISILVTKVAD